ncbi:MAG: RimK family alpha-L-glutamate ligase [Methylococcaceae bacterium]|nr:RimK family alpha-L-glutamate ligase [Methylococcaceae bacterium]
MGRIAVFTDDPGWHGKQLKLAFANLGYSCDFVSLTECRFTMEPGQLPLVIPGFEGTLPDAVFVRGVPGGSLEEVVLYLDVLHALKLLAVPVYNDGHAIERSVDKGMTSFLLHNAGLPTPLTWVLRNRTDALAIAEHELKNGHMLISKPLFGSQGIGIRRIEKMTDLFWLTGSHGVYYLQRFIQCYGTGYSDNRVFVINGRVIAMMCRRGKSWLNNVAQGASCECIDVEPEMVELAIQATAALNMDYAGVDIIRDRAGDYWVIEINSIPAWKGLQSVCNVNIAALLANDLASRYLSKQAHEIAVANSR